MYYNQDKKERFIYEYYIIPRVNDLSSAKDSEEVLDESKVLQNANYRMPFKKTSVYENKFGKDISEMTRDEYITTLTGLSANKVSILKRKLGMIKAYLKWCMSNGETNNIEELLTVNESDLNRVGYYRYTMFRDAEKLNRWLDAIFPPVNDFSYRNYCRLFDLLLFDGISQYQIIELKNENIDYDNGICNYEGRSYILSEYTIKLLRVLKEKLSASYRSETKENYSQSVQPAGSYSVRLEPSDYVIKKTLKSKCINNGERSQLMDNLSSIQSRCANAYMKSIGALDKPTYRTIYLSGMFYIFKMHFKETGEKDYSEIIMAWDMIKDFAVSYDEMIKEIDRVYESWKYETLPVYAAY